MSAPTLERAPAPPGIRTGAVARREARLRPKFAALYPGLGAGEWAPAAVVADRVLAQSLGGERHGLRLRRKA